jgi:hypothetical protein
VAANKGDIPGPPVGIGIGAGPASLGKISYMAQRRFNISKACQGANAIARFAVDRGLLAKLGVGGIGILLKFRRKEIDF